MTADGQVRPIRQAAHDLNNALTAIDTYAALVGDVVKGDEQATQDIEQIRLAARNAAVIVQELFLHDPPGKR